MYGEDGYAFDGYAFAESGEAVSIDRERLLTSDRKERVFTVELTVYRTE